MYEVTIVGAGLAGSEAAFQLANLAKEYGIELQIKLYEMRPKVQTPAHHTDKFAELVCSNSLGSEFLTTARGLLIQEMKLLNSLIIDSAIKSKVPAGQALAVDRDLFAELISQKISENLNIEIIREEFKNISSVYLDDREEIEKFLVIASGPLTSMSLAEEIQRLTSSLDFLKFFDAASPIIAKDSINMDIAFKASRYGKGETDDYINCPFYNAEDYYKFHEALVNAERAPLKDFEKENMRYFEGCMPVEAIAERGKETLRFGPLKPVGLRDPRHPDKRPYAVVQLRQDNVLGSLYNIVGFQTNLKWGEQKRIFSMIPGLENLEILRYGVMHQNIFLNSPMLLNRDLSLKQHPRVYFAGQITGVEGYTESAATGIAVARSVIKKILKLRGNKKTNKDLNSKTQEEDEDSTIFPKLTMHGALINYIISADPKTFQPINSNWALVNPNPEEIDKKILKDKKLKNEFLANRALRLMKESLEAFTESLSMILS